MFEPVKAVHAYESIVEQIESAVLDGRLSPGDRLPSERQLISEFGVSRATVREALRVLQSSGMIESKPGDPRGPLVLPFSTGNLERSLAVLTAVEQVQLSDLLQFRMLIESASSNIAAWRRNPDLVAKMERAVDQMRRAIDSHASSEEFAEADLAFHEAKMEAADNPLLSSCNAVVRDLVIRLVAEKVSAAQDTPAQMAETVRHHEDLLEAIRRGDSHEAEALSRLSIYEYYANLVPAEEREGLRILLSPDKAAKAAPTASGH